MSGEDSLLILSNSDF